MEWWFLLWPNIVNPSIPECINVIAAAYSKFPATRLLVYTQQIDIPLAPFKDKKVTISVNFFPVTTIADMVLQNF